MFQSVNSLFCLSLSLTNGTLLKFLKFLSWKFGRCFYFFLIFSNISLIRVFFSLATTYWMSGHIHRWYFNFFHLYFNRSSLWLVFLVTIIPVTISTWIWPWFSWFLTIIAHSSWIWSFIWTDRRFPRFFTSWSFINLATILVYLFIWYLQKWELQLIFFHLKFIIFI